MRFKLHLQPQGVQKTLPINYQYEASAWIYKTIHNGNPEFAAWLHDHGYTDGKKQFRFFTFSNILAEKYRIKGDRFEILSDICSLHVSFHTDEAAEPFIVGLFKTQEFTIGDHTSKVRFHVLSVEKLLEPIWKAAMTFRTQSPVVVSIKESDTSPTATYLSPTDLRFADAFFGNLRTRIFAMKKQQGENLSNDPYQHQKFDIAIDGKVRSKLVKIKAGTNEETMVRGFLFDFTIIAPIDYLKMGYYAGFGEKGSLGFGCVE